MSEFEFLALGVSLILGLVTTQLLTSFLAVFVNRRKIRIDWIPLVWAFYILVIEIQYYSAIWNLNTITEWTVLMSSTPLLLAGLIFLAAGLVLPSAHGDYPSDLGVYFQENRKWAIAALPPGEWWPSSPIYLRWALFASEQARPQSTRARPLPQQAQPS